MAKKLSKSGPAILVSRKLQLALVAVVGVTALFQLIVLVKMYLLTDVEYSQSYAFSVILTTLTPILIFVVTYLFESNRASRLHRVFIAGLKAMVAILAVQFILSVKNYLPFFVSSVNSPGHTIPNWITSFAVDNIVYAATLTAVLVYSLLKYLHKK